MNLEMIQAKLQDIEQMRSISAENENTMSRWKGRSLRIFNLCRQTRASQNRRIADEVVLYNSRGYQTGRDRECTAGVVNHYRSDTAIREKFEDAPRWNRGWMIYL